MRWARWRVVIRPIGAAVLGTALALSSGCEGLLDVEDTSTFGEEALRDPAAADFVANGALYAAQRGWDHSVALLSLASDEFRQAGPYKYWIPLDDGDISDPFNAGLNSLYPRVAAGWWVTDEAIAILDSLNQEGALEDTSPLARAYFYGAVARPAVADVLEDYAPSDKTVTGPPIGTTNMGSVYDEAADYATAGLALQPTGDLRRDLLAARARALHAKSVWERIRPVPADTTGGGLVRDPDATADALAALATDPADWSTIFGFPQEVGFRSETIAPTCTGLGNFMFGYRFVYDDPPFRVPDSVAIRDPIDDVPDPVVDSLVFRVFASSQCGQVDRTVFSAREMRLIVAEDALAQGDTVTFAQYVNEVRAAEGLTPWDAASGVDARDLLIYERATQLYLMGRRLADLYRFGLQSDRWDPVSDAATSPGTLYPIPSDEIAVNCYLNGSCG